MYTTLFALGRIPGWIAQYREMLADPATRIGRPRQVYTGVSERDFVPASQRGFLPEDTVDYRVPDLK